MISQMRRPIVCHLVIPTIGVVLLASGCGGSDAGVATSIAAATTAPKNTAEIFTEVPSGDSVPGTADLDIAPSSSSTATELTTTTPAVTTAPGRATTTTTTTIAAPPGSTTPAIGYFVVTSGSAFIDGKSEPTIAVHARAGASGDVQVPVGTVLDISIPGPVDWDFLEDPDESKFEYIDIDTVPDGEDDPFPEVGGATVITLRPLKAGTTTFVFLPFDTTDDTVAVRVIVN